MIDPDIMDQITREMASKGEITPRNIESSSLMNDMSAYEEFVAPDNLSISAMDESQFNFGDQNKFVAAEVGGDSQFGESQGRELPGMPAGEDYPSIGHMDARIGDSGPSLSEIESWKEQYEMEGLNIWIVDDLPGDTIFVYRDINRYEYKSIHAAPNTDPLMREELICQQCILWPMDFSFELMSSTRAGVISVLAQHILETSGFTRASMPRRL